MRHTALDWQKISKNTLEKGNFQYFEAFLQKSVFMDLLRGEFSFKYVDHIG